MPRDNPAQDQGFCENLPWALSVIALALAVACWFGLNSGLIPSSRFTPAPQASVAVQPSGG